MLSASRLRAVTLLKHVYPPLRSYAVATSHPPRLRERTAIITGSSSGLGRAICLAYASHGTNHIICADLRPEPRPEGVDSDPRPTHELINELYGHNKASFFRTDVTSSSDVENAVASAVDLTGKLDIMVNNAGLGNASGTPRIHLLKDEAWETVMRVNSTGVYYGCKHAIAQMMRQPLNNTDRRGWVVNVSSMLGYVGIKGGTAAYCASKGAVLNLTRQIALDYAPDRIHVNALCPGFTKTAMTRDNFEDEKVNNEMIATTPWGDWGNTTDVAKAAVFLASDDAAWVTGVGEFYAYSGSGI